MTRRFALPVALFLAALLSLPFAASAQTEIPPPSGKGPVVVFISGQSGAARYQPKAEQVAALGYDVILLDGNDLEGTHGAALKSAVQAAQTAAHGIPGKVALVGFSLGGGLALAYGSRWPDLVSGIVVWYPLTRTIKDPTSFAAGIQVPVLMFAGEQDSYKSCCMIDQARAIAAAAASAGTPLVLVTYPNAGHDFTFQGDSYDAAADQDSWQRAVTRLAQFLPH